MKKIFTLIILLFAFGMTQAQTLKTGALFDQSSWNNAKRLAPNGTRSKKNIPKRFSLRSYAPKAHAQGYGDCVAWSAANALTIMEAYENSNKNTKDITENMFSPAHIYHSLKNSYGDDNTYCDYGIYIYNDSEFNTLDFLENDGCHRRKNYELSFSQKKKVKSKKEEDSYCFYKEELVLNTATTKIKGYYPAINADSTISINLIKEAIAEGKPAISDIEIYTSFGDLSFSNKKLE